LHQKRKNEVPKGAAVKERETISEKNYLGVQKRGTQERKGGHRGEFPSRNGGAIATAGGVEYRTTQKGEFNALGKGKDGGRSYEKGQKGHPWEERQLLDRLRWGIGGRQGKKKKNRSSQTGGEKLLEVTSAAGGKKGGVQTLHSRQGARQARGGG